MKIVISGHAKDRMKERGISDFLVFSALLQPDKVERDKTASSRFVAKKVYLTKRKKKYLLLVVYKVQEKEIKVITVISSSKIKKYL